MAHAGPKASQAGKCTTCPSQPLLTHVGCFFQATNLAVVPIPLVRLLGHQVSRTQPNNCRQDWFSPCAAYWYGQFCNWSHPWSANKSQRPCSLGTDRAFCSCITSTLSLRCCRGGGSIRDTTPMFRSKNTAVPSSVFMALLHTMCLDAPPGGGILYCQIKSS